MLAAVTLPTLIAYNLPPPARFFNQTAAYVGGGACVALPGSMPGGIAVAQCEPQRRRKQFAARHGMTIDFDRPA